MLFLQTDVEYIKIHEEVSFVEEERIKLSLLPPDNIGGSLLKPHHWWFYNSRALKKLKYSVIPVIIFGYSNSSANF